MQVALKIRASLSNPPPDKARPVKITRNPNLTPATDAEQATALTPLEGMSWTGLEPQSCPGFLADEGVLTSLAAPNLATCTRDEVRDYFNNTWTLTEVLFSALTCQEAYYTAPYHQLRHPLVFYYAHPPALYVNKLRVVGLIDAPIDPFYETLFETGVDEMSWDDMSKNEMSWPTLAEARAYRERAYTIVLELIDSHPGLAEGHDPITWEDPLWVLFLGFEHERIHIETSSVLMRELPLAWLRRPQHWPANAPSSGDSPSEAWLESQGGSVSLGKARETPSYGWDNEYGSDQREVQPFAISQHLTSNAQFHAFVVAGGYREERFWTPEGWGWRCFRNAKWPTYWTSDGPAGLNAFKLRTTFELVEFPERWPVVVNYHEAKAYAAWRAEQDASESEPEVTYRLPTEAEYTLLKAEAGALAADAVLSQDSAGFRAKGTNLNLAYGSEGPVDLDPSGGPRDLFGNLWRWCEDDFHPFPGAQVHPAYDDFSSPCYDGEHTMILGGSFVSTGNEASVYSRFHFRPHFFQHAGFHLVRDPRGESVGDAIRLGGGARGQADKYERSEVLASYLELHYGTPAEAMPYALARAATEFPKRCADLVLETAKTHGVELKRALDIGCAVGRSSFELARGCPDVTGIDLSAAFVETCWHLQAEGSLDYRARTEGELNEPRSARVDPALDRDRVTFRRADAMGLPPEYEGFDAVLIANVFCRLPSPGACLRRLGGARGLVRPGGILVATSPYSWHPDFTPREVWLGGQIRDGQPTWGTDGLRELLEPEFEFLGEQDMPFVIREHIRKFELVFAHATVWRHRS